MLQLSTSIRQPTLPTLLDRVRDVLDALDCDRVWARTSGPHVLIGLRGDEAFARLTPLAHNNAWEPLLLVDELEDVVEHALVAVDAVPHDA